MLKHPISAFFRLFPTLAWLAACAVTLWIPASLYSSLQAQGRWSDLGKAWPALRADTPISLGLLLPRRRPQPFTPTRHPLSDSLRTELRKLIETLQSAGMLQPGEVTIDAVIDCAETLDEWSEVDLYMAMHVLHALQFERGRPFANIAFFAAGTETDESDAVKIVHELVRLCERPQELSAVRVRSINANKIVPAPGGSFPPPNAVAEIELGGEYHAVPFVLYRKNLPNGLVQGLAKVLIAADDERRFVWDFFDSFFSVSYLTATQTAAVNGAEREETPRFAVVQ